MNKRKRDNQSGSAHAVIIIILIVAILGLLGFIFWQNFIQKNDTTPTKSITTTTPATTTPATTSIATKSTAISLPISTYGVEVPYDSTSDTYTLAPRTTGGFAGGYTIFSKKVTEACGSSVNIGAIKRFNKGDSIPTPSSTVALGDYIYALGAGGYGDCGSGSGMTVLENASSAFSAAFNNLKTSN